MVEKAQQTGYAVGQSQDSIVENRLRIVPSWFHEKDLTVLATIFPSRHYYFT